MVAVAVSPAAGAPTMLARNWAATTAAPVAMARLASAPLLRKAAGSPMLVREMAGAKRVHVATAATVGLLPTVRTPHAAMAVVAIREHRHVITVPRNLALAAFVVRSNALAKLMCYVMLNLFQHLTCAATCEVRP